MIPLLSIVIDERTKPADLEHIVRNLREVVRELQLLPFASAKVAKVAVVLADGVPTPIPHGLGRRAFVWHSPPRGASTTGRIEEVRDSSHDSNKFVVLKATGWGASITVDVCVL